MTITDAALHDAYLTSMRERLSKYTVDADGCQLWGGYVDRNGYGRVYDPIRGGLYWVHIVSHEVHKGPVPPGHEVDHTCQKTLCIRPKCIEAVTKPEHAARTFRRLGKDDRHLMAAELRRLRLTFAEIAEVMGLAGKGSARDMVEAAVRKGLVEPTDVPPARQLTDPEREDIRDLHAFGVPQGVLAECYGVHPSQVSRICAGKRSGHR